MTIPKNIYYLGGTSTFFEKISAVLLSLCLLLGTSLVSVQAQNLLPETSSKYRITRQVFDRLTYVFANSRPQPQLEIIARNSNKPKTIASYKPDNRPLIQLDEEVYDLCTKLGSDSLNALAVLLSHELAHHYEKHDWHYTFGIGKSANNVSKEDIQKSESEADFYGCFYGELAGFATGRVFPQILDLVYQYFQLTDPLPGYFSKEERKTVYQKKRMEAAGMVAIFKAGKFLFLIKEFESAALCFSNLANSFPSREIFNNLSAVKLQQALQLYNSQTRRPFVYPVELDARSRLVTIPRVPPSAGNLTDFQQLLGEARKYAEDARRVDPEYVPAYINLACIHSLLDNQPAAVGVINELGNRITGNAHTMRGIAYYKDKQPEKAQKDFEAAQQKKAYMAEYNLALFNKLNDKSYRGNLMSWSTSWLAQEGATSSHHTTLCNNRERIREEAITTSLSAQASQLMISEKPYLVIQWQEDNEQLAIGIQTVKRSYLVKYTKEIYLGKTARAVKQGTHQTALIEQYGKPTYTFAGASEEYWIYQDCNLIFEVGKHGRVNTRFFYSKTP